MATYHQNVNSSIIMDLIYHYTNASALLGMFKNCSKENPYITMWATHALYLNDPTEYEYGKEKCYDILPILEEKMGIPVESRISTMRDMYITEMSKLRDFISSTRPNSIQYGTPYLISFSKSEDSLPMWSNYAQNGNGIAIGFNPDKLSEHIKIKDCKYNIAEIDYNELIDEIQIDYNIALSGICEANKDSDKELAILDFMTMFHPKIASFIKHNSYEYEQEVRCRALNANEILFRESNGLIIPYVEVNIPYKYIERIYIGPTVDAQRMKNALSMMWHKHRINGINVRTSEIPYRG